jgi:ferredoxin
MGYTVRIDSEACISSGDCVREAPDAFGFDEDYNAKVLPGVTALPDDRLFRIARDCPAGAIILVDADGNEIDLFG